MYTEKQHQQNVEHFVDVGSQLIELYSAKNRDYGDSFSQSYAEEGMAMVRIRLGDKFNRLKRLTLTGEQHVKDESIRDTLMDIANYAIMTIMELDREEAKKNG